MLSEIAISFIVSVLAGVAANYITQRLRDRKRNGDDK